MGKSKVDLGGLTDSELEGLMSEMQQENLRRNKLGNSNASLLKSRWMVSLVLLAIAFFILFKAESSSMEDGSKDVVTAKTGEKEAWLIEPDHKQVVEDEKEPQEEIDEPVADEPAMETPSEATPQVADPASVPQEEVVQETTEAEPVGTTQTEAAVEETTTAEETTTQSETTPETPAPETPAPAPETSAPAPETPTTASEPETPVAEEPATVTEEIEEETTSAAAAETPKVVPVGETPPADTIYGSFPWKKASDDDKKAAFAQGTRPKVRYLYKRRCKLASGICPLDDPAEKQKLAQQWGSWTLTDPKASERPTNDYAKDFPKRDIPWDKFPANAWQVDQDYLPKFLKESKDLVERALEAILAEHGRSKFDMPGKSFEERVAGSSFWVEYLDLNQTTFDGGVNRKSFKGDVYGGWVEYKYFDGLVRRLMHSVITEDTFTLVMGGHSASAGHGNHFQQSYTLQFFKVMEPIFARLGVKLHATNNGYGGLGTGQSHLAGGDMYGREIDILIWDSGMTEPSAEAYDLFVRQVFLSGNRIPVLMGGFGAGFHKLYKDSVTSEMGQFGDGHYGAPLVEDAVQAASIPWAARYLNCTSETHGLCRSMEYNGTCWIERDDYTPETPQQKEPGGRASWHPGMRVR
jgi:cell division protein FtsN